MRSSSNKPRTSQAVRSNRDPLKAVEYVDSRTWLRRTNQDKGVREQQFSHPFNVLSQSPQEPPRNPASKMQSAPRYPISKLTGQALYSPQKYVPDARNPGLDSSNDLYSENLRISELLLTTQRELNQTRGNIIEMQGKYEKLLKDQKYYISELESENLKATREITSMKSQLKKELDSIQERDSRVLSDAQKRNKESEDQNKFYIQENIKLRQQHEKEVYSLKNTIKELESKCEMHKREFSTYQNQNKKYQEEMSFKEEFIRKLHEGVKDKAKTIYELKQSNEQYLGFLQDREQRLANIEKELKKEKETSKLYSDKVNELLIERNYALDSKSNERISALNRKSEERRVGKQPIIYQSPERLNKAADLSLETSLKNARISDIVPIRDESLKKLRTQAVDLEAKVNSLVSENLTLKKENQSLAEHMRTLENDLRAAKSASKITKPQDRRLRAGHKEEATTDQQLNNLNQHLGQKEQKIAYLQEVNSDISEKLEITLKENEKLKRFYQDLVAELDGKKQKIVENEQTNKYFINKHENLQNEYDAIKREYKALLEKAENETKYRLKVVDNLRNCANWVKDTRKILGIEGNERSLQDFEKYDGFKLAFAEILKEIDILMKRGSDRGESERIKAAERENKALVEINKELKESFEDLKQTYEEYVRKEREAKKDFAGIAKDNFDLKEQLTITERNLSIAMSELEKCRKQLEDVTLAAEINDSLKSNEKIEGLTAQINILIGKLREKDQQLSILKEKEINFEAEFLNMNSIIGERTEEIDKLLEANEKLSQQLHNKQDFANSKSEQAVNEHIVAIKILEEKLQEVSTRESKHMDKIESLTENLEYVSNGLLLKTRELEAAESELNLVRADLEASNFNIKSLQDSLRSADSESLKQVENLQSTLSKLVGEKSSLNSSIKDLTNHINSLSQDLSVKTSELLIANRTADDAQKYLNVQTEKLQKLEVELKERESKFKSTEIQRLKLQNLLKDTEEELKGIKEEHIRLLRENELKEEANNGEHEISSMQSLHSEKIKSLTENLESVNQELLSKTYDLQTADSNIALLSTNLEASELKIKILQDSLRSAEELSSKQLEQLQSTIAKLVSEKSLLNTSIKDLTNHINSLSQDLAEKTSELLLAKRSAEDTHKYQNTLTEKLQKFEADLKEKESKLKSIEIQRLKLQKSLQNSEEDSKCLKEENFRLIKELEEREQGNNNDNEISSMQSFYLEKIKSLTETLESTNQELLSKVYDLQTAESNLKTLSANLESSELNNKILQDSLRSVEDFSTNQTERLQSEQAKLISEKSLLNSNIKDLTNRNNSLSQDLAEKISALSLATRAAEDAHKYQNLLTEKLQKLEADLKDRESKLKSTEIQRLKLQKSLKDSEEDLKCLKEENFRLIKELEEKQESDHDAPEILMDYKPAPADNLKVHIENEIKLTEKISELNELTNKQFKQIKELKEEIKLSKSSEPILLEIEYKRIKNHEKPPVLIEIEYKKIKNYDKAPVLIDIEYQEIKNESEVEDIIEIQYEVQTLKSIVEELEKKLHECREHDSEKEGIIKHLYTSNDHLEKELAKFKAENSELNKYIDETNMASIEASIESVKSEEFELRNLKIRIEEFEAESKALKNALSCQEGLVKDKRSELSFYINENNLLKSKVEVFESNLHHLGELLEDKDVEIKNIVEEANRRISQANAEFFSMQSRMLNKIQECDEVEKEIKKLNLRIHELLSTVTALDQEKISMNEEKLIMLQKLESKETQISEITEETNRMITQTNSEINTLKDNANKKEQESSLKDKRIKSLQSQLKILEKQVKENEAERRTIIEENISLIRQIESLEDANIKSEMRENAIASEDAYEKQRILLEKISRLESELEKSKSNIKKLKSKLEESVKIDIEYLPKDASEEINSLKAELIEIQARSASEIANLVLHVTEKTKLLEALKDSKLVEPSAQEQENLKALNDNLLEKSERVNKLEKSLKEKETRIKFLETQKSKLRNELETAEDELKTLRQENYQLAKQFEDLQDQISDANLDKADKELSNLRKEDEKSKKIIKSLQDDIEKNNKTIKSLQEDLDKNISALNKLKAEGGLEVIEKLKDLSYQIEYLTNMRATDKENWEKEAAKHKKEIELLRRQQKIKEDEIRSELGSLKEENFRLATDHEANEDNIHKLTEDLQHHQTAIKELQTQNHSLRQQLSMVSPNS